MQASMWQRMRVMVDTSSGLSDSLVNGAGVQGRAFQKTVFPDAATERRVAVIPRIYIKSAAIHRIPSVPNGQPANCHGHVVPMAQRPPQ